MKETRDLSRELAGVLKKYQGDTHRILKDHVRLDYLYALSGQRESLMDWYPFRADGVLLEAGAGYGALTGVYSRKVSRVHVLDPDEDNLELNRLRHVELGGRTNISYETGELCSYAASCDEKYDYVVFAGTLGDHAKEEIRAARKLLKPGGEILAAVCNRFGIKYWAGAEKDPCSFSLRQLLDLMSEREGDVEIYYPMPDYRLPVTIFSDRYLPGKGDLTDTVTAYDYPDYLAMDVGARFDQVCEDGRFPQYANSYLAVWKKEGEAGEDNNIEYVKYNRTRRERFQIRTVITGPARQVEKEALREEGTDHIRAFEKTSRELNRQHDNLKFAWPDISGDGKRARFPYIEGETLSERLGRAIRDGQGPVETVRQAMDMVLQVRPECRKEFSVTEGFTEVFGDLPKRRPAGWESLEVSNIDMLFENILLSGEDRYCLDYEWVFLFPVPAEYIRYRILFYFFRQYRSLLTDYNSPEAWLKEFGITRDLAELYQNMEKHFQDYVHGENQKIYLENYYVKAKTVKELSRVDGELERTRERLEQLRMQLGERDLTIRKMTEVQRLTQNHVTNLEIMIGDLRHEIGEMGKTLTYLNRHEAVVFKIRRKLGEKFNQKYPRGSRERKQMSYLKEYVLHPVRSARFYGSEEGRNLREGDFAIGSEYREHGRLVFPVEEAPEVSIIIPVYNQIHYTYVCLVSILEHTKDVSYEVIIADDVSTDATRDLDQYAAGLVICRNETNQGFLRNCNHAAACARGRYLMFLNNDTQVTEGWLSSLVNLIRSDDSIGMVGSKLVYPDGRLQEAGGIIWSDGSGWNYGRLDNPDKPEYNYVKDVDYISGAAILLPRKLWERIGGFDERYAPAYCEDSDLAFEVRKAGFRVVYQPLSKVIHYEGVSNGTDVEGTGLKRYQVENSQKLKEKWAKEFSRQCVNNGNPDPFRARERTVGKPMILVIDHYVPTYDKDAGSRTTYQYLKMFLNMGYAVKFLGDNFLHEEPYSTQLQQMGIEILYGPEYQVGIWNWLKDHGDDIQFAYLNRPHIASKYIDYIKENTNMKVIYYGHDLHFLREGREYELTGDPDRHQAAAYWRSVELSLMYKAAVSYYPSYVERDAIKAVDEEIPVKDIVAYVYDRFRQEIPEDFSGREGILFVGGFAHPPNADGVMWFVREIYPVIRRKMEERHEKIPPFYVAGSRVTDEIRALEQPGNGVVIKGFVSEEELARLYDSVRIVAVPLRYGAGVKGKVVEAMYNGAAIVTTSIGAEGLAGAGEVMAVEDEARAFGETLAELYTDPARCLALSRGTRKYVRDHYSQEAAWNVIKEDFQVRSTE